MNSIKEKIKAGYNRTITLDGAEIEEYLKLCDDGCRFESDSVVHGDFFEVAEKLPYKFADLVIADPPYNLNKTYGDSKFKKKDNDEYRVFTENWINKIKPLLKSTASVYVCCDWKSSLIIGAVLAEHFYVQNRITWQREKGRGSASNWKNSMEDIWFATVSKKDYIFNVGDVKIRKKVIAPYKVDGKPKDWIDSAQGKYRDTHPSNFWDDISVPFWSMPENTDHPAQKPEKLIAKLILASSNEGDVVFDPFLGSGTTAVVAKKLGRKYVGIEREREYCALAQKRLEIARVNQRIQGYDDGVFWERNSRI